MTHDEADSANVYQQNETETILEPMEILQKRLAALHCHFTWAILEGLVGIDVEDKIEQISHDVRMNIDVEPQARSLMAFLYTQLENPNWHEASKQIELAVERSKQFVDQKEERARGFLAVALADAAHIAFSQNKSIQEVERLLEATEVVTRSGIGNFKMESGVLGTHAYAHSVMDKSKHIKGLELFREAYTLDPTCFEWPMGAAILAGRVRRLAEGPQSLPTEMELELLNKAVELSNAHKAVPIVLLADVLFALGRSYTNSTFPESKTLLQQAKGRYLQALDLAPDSTPVLKRCGKALSILGDARMAEKCLSHAVNLDPTNSVIMHRLGQTYEFGLKELSKARHCYSKATTLEKRRNLFAELDLARVCKKQDPKYDLDKHLQDMRPRYAGDKRAEQQLETAIKKQEEHQRQWLINNRNGHHHHSRPALQL